VDFAHHCGTHRRLFHRSHRMVHLDHSSGFVRRAKAVTAAELAAKWRARGYAVEPEFRRASNKIAVETLAFCRKKITELIYAKPIPTRSQVAQERQYASFIAKGQIPANTPFIPGTPKRGSKGAQKAWKRTGALRRGERVEVPNSYRVDVVNDVVYAEPRHEAGKPGRRRTRFPAHWRDEWKQEFRPRVQMAYREAVLRIMKQGGA